MYFHSDIRDDDERAGWLIRDARGQRDVLARARAGLLSLLYSCRSTKVSRYNEPRAKIAGLASRAPGIYESITNESIRELFFYAARAFPPFRHTTRRSFPASSKWRDSPS